MHGPGRSCGVPMSQLDAAAAHIGSPMGHGGGIHLGVEGGPEISPTTLGAEPDGGVDVGIGITSWVFDNAANSKPFRDYSMYTLRGVHLELRS